MAVDVYTPVNTKHVVVVLQERMESSNLVPFIMSQRMWVPQEGMGVFVLLNQYIREMKTQKWPDEANLLIPF